MTRPQFTGKQGIFDNSGANTLIAPISANNSPDNYGGKGLIGTALSLCNGNTYDNFRNNTQGVLLASAARNSSVTSPIQTNYNAKGILLVLKVTVASGTGGLSPILQDGNGIWLRTPGNDLTAITAVGNYGIVFYPGVIDYKMAGPGTGNIIQKNNSPIPRIFQVSVQAGDSSSYTYELDYSLIL